ncbi:hypothetical protein GWK47_051884 [Chionoecetes opilio]|uniref:Uncharacterized protein n=1 Tax=Chionoecetes opilio TaxID=41210 RepID=A0A8J4Y1U1_CHIOP|nr:hypothetical protein GWK47_051884 [Chionoecetes opilio]
MATLAIKEIKVSQTKGIIATKLDQVNRAFNISRKVVLTTTDNGANYVAAFSNYGSGIGEAEEDATNPDVEEVINSPEDQEREGLDIISVTMALAAAAAVQDSPRLPKHQRCRQVKAKFI